MLDLFRDIFAPPRQMILPIITAWIGLILAEKRAGRHGLSKEALNNLAITCLIAYFLGGRILYVIKNFPVFQITPLSVFSINLGLFDPAGAIVSGFLAIVVYSHRHGPSLWAVLDALTPLLAILGVGFALSHLADGSEFGLPTDLPWGIILWNAARHPTQIYNTIASLLIFGVIWGKKPGNRPGIDILVFTALTAGTKLIIEGFQADRIIIADGYNWGQIKAWIVLAACFIAIELRIKERTNGKPAGMVE